jgi:hypothetical protein
MSRQFWDRSSDNVYASDNMKDCASFFRYLSDDDKERFLLISQEWDDARLHIDRQESIRQHYARLHIDSYVRLHIDRQESIRRHYDGRVSVSILQDLIAYAPERCEKCDSNRYHINSYTDGDDVVCGTCNGIAYMFNS